MSIIVLKNGYVVADGQYTDNDLITNDDYVKTRVFGDNKRLFFVGAPCNLELLINHYLSGEPVPEISKTANISAIVFDGLKIYHCWIESTKGEVVRESLPLDKPFAIGCGAPHAFTALDMGASALAAVKMTVKRDIYCGGTIRQWEFVTDIGKGVFDFKSPTCFFPEYSNGFESKTAKKE